MVAMGINC